MDKDGFSSLGNIVNVCQVEELHLRHCELTAYNLYGMLHSLDGLEHKVTVTSYLAWRNLA